MGLPNVATAWPPKDFQHIRETLLEYEAWWAGDPVRLQNVYQYGNPTQTGMAVTYNGSGTLLSKFRRRLFWSDKTSPETASTPKLHIPVAAQIAQTSADMLYSDSPTITSDSADIATQDRLNLYLEHGLRSALLEGAELSAAYSGRYHVVNSIASINDGVPFISSYDPTNVIPEWEWGHLRAATIVAELESDTTRVLRHLERHELSPDGHGLTYHGLYDGTPNSLGRAIPITEHESLRPLAEHLNPDGQTVGNSTPGLDIFYIPNLTPQRRWRNNRYGHNMGRSDFEDAIPIMDALDEAWTSWMRDLKNGRSRIFASRQMFDDAGPGQGLRFNEDRDIYELLDFMPNMDKGDSTPPIKDVQFKIRVDEHERTCNALYKQAISAANYSASTFGEHEGDSNITATEVRAREKRTLQTRGRKIANETPVLVAILRKMLRLDQANGVPGLNPEAPISVSFPEGVAESSRERGEAVQMLRSARVMSIQTGVEIMHPEWDSTTVGKEVQRILTEDTIDLAYPGDWEPPETGPEPDTES